MEISMLWSTDGIGDGLVGGYPQDTVTEMYRMLWNQTPATQGVAFNYLNELLVSNPSGQTLRVASGGGVCYGFPYRNTSNVDMSLVTPTVGNTAWRMVLRTDWLLRTVRVHLLQSPDGSPAYPALTQVAGYLWEIGLAHGLIGVGGAVTIVADDRTFLGSSVLVDQSDIVDRNRRFFVIPGEQWDDTAGAFPMPNSPRGGLMDDNSTSRFYARFAVPNNFLSAMTVRPLVIGPAAGPGDLFVDFNVHYAQIGEAWNTHSHGAGAWVACTIAGNDLAEFCGAAVAMTFVATGDIVWCSFSRNAPNAADTYGADAYFVGFLVEYWGDS